jgi:hypothetical protein
MSGVSHGQAQVEQAAGGEEIIVKKTGGVQEIKRAEVTTTRIHIEKDIEEEKQKERIAMEKVGRMNEELQLHKKLESEADALATLKDSQSQEEMRQAGELRDKVEMFKQQEIEFERQRAEAHRNAVQAEEERVHLIASQVLHREEANEARKLAAQHREGEVYCEAMARHHDFEAQEARLRQKKLEQMEETTVAHHIPTTVEAAHINVQVKPRDIPIQRELDTRVPHQSKASATMTESVPPMKPISEELEHEEKSKIHYEQTRTTSEGTTQKSWSEERKEEHKEERGGEQHVEKERKSTGASKSTSHSGAADVVSAIFDVITGKK